MTPTMKEHMTVDTTLGQRLRVNVNMTFHALTCADVHLDAMDVAGRKSSKLRKTLQNSLLKIMNHG